MENDETSPISKTAGIGNDSTSYVNRAPRTSGPTARRNVYYHDYGTSTHKPTQQGGGYRDRVTKSITANAADLSMGQPRCCPIDECRRSKRCSASTAQPSDELKRNEDDSDVGIVRWQQKSSAQPLLYHQPPPPPQPPPGIQGMGYNGPPQSQFQPVLVKCNCCELRYCCWPRPRQTDKGMWCTCLAVERCYQCCASAPNGELESAVHQTQSTSNNSAYEYPRGGSTSSMQRMQDVDVPTHTVPEKLVIGNGQLRPTFRPQHGIAYTRKYIQTIQPSNARMMRRN